MNHHLLTNGQRLFALSASIPSLVIGFISLYAWIFEIPWLLKIDSISQPISFNGAVVLLLCVISFIAFVCEYRRVARILALAIIVISSLFVIESIFKVDLGIDELLFKSNMDFEVSTPGRPAANSMISTLFVGLVLYGISLPPPPSFYTLLFAAFGCVAIIVINISSTYGFVLGIEHTIMWFDLSSPPLIGQVICLAFGGFMLYLISAIFYKYYPFESVFYAPTLIAISGFCVFIIIFLSYLASERVGTEKTMQERADYLAKTIFLQIPQEFIVINHYKDLLSTQPNIESIWSEIAQKAFALSPGLKELAIISSEGKILNQNKSSDFLENINYANLTPLFSAKEKGVNGLSLTSSYVILWLSLESQKFLVTIYEPIALFFPEVMMKWMMYSDIDLAINDTPVILHKQLLKPDEAYSFTYDNQEQNDQLHLKMDLNPLDIMTIKSGLNIMTVPLIVLIFFIIWMIYFFQKVKIVTFDLQKALQTQTIFLANISHDMRTPLHGVSGAANLLANTNLDPKQNDLVKLINLSTKDLKDLVSNVLDITKIESGKSMLVKAKCDVVQLCEQHIHDLQAVVFKKDIQIIFDYPKEGIPLLSLPEGAYSSILNNLLSNALAFTEKGNITLRLEFKAINGKRGLLTSIITDTGVGIPPEKLPYLFNKFRPAHLEQTKKTAEGAGLGLYLTKLILDAMHGTIEVKSELNCGSTFTATIPVEISQ